MDLASITKALAGLPIPDIRFFPCTGSTNEDALHWAAEGARDGSLIIADLQTSGRGRQGRKWITRAGSGLAVSFIFRPTQKEIGCIQLFSSLGANAVCQAIRNQYATEAWVKWPNDVLLNQKKVGGILAETSWLNEEIEALVLGIGVNLCSVSLPEKMTLRYPATCLEEECQQPIDRLEFLRAVCQALFRLRPRLGSENFLRTSEELLAFRGEWVRLETGENKIEEGKLKGINSQGHLILIKNNALEYAYAMGEIRLLPKP